jgi:hypothetical protein
MIVYRKKRFEFLRVMFRRLLATDCPLIDIKRVENQRCQEKRTTGKRFARIFERIRRGRASRRENNGSRAPTIETVEYTF